MKPDRSVARTTCLPSTSEANCSARATAPSDVESELITSTSGSTGTGLKKCRPSTRPGFFPAAKRDPLDRQARGVGREHGVGVGDHRVELGEDVRLHALVLDDGLDHQLAIGEIGEVGGEPQPLGGLVALALGGFTLP